MDNNEMRKVLNHFGNGGTIEARLKKANSDCSINNMKWTITYFPTWNLAKYDYRIASIK